MFSSLIQANLRDTADAIRYHHKKQTSQQGRSHDFFDFPVHIKAYGEKRYISISYQSYIISVWYTIKCATAVCLKNVYSLILLVTPCDIWDLSSPTRGWSCTLGWTADHWTAREFPAFTFLYIISNYFPSTTPSSFFPSSILFSLRRFGTLPQKVS